MKRITSSPVFMLTTLAAGVALVGYLNMRKPVSIGAIPTSASSGVNTPSVAAEPSTATGGLTPKPAASSVRAGTVQSGTTRVQANATTTTASVTATAARAEVLRDGQTLQLTPNEIGLYPQLSAKAGQTIALAVYYADGEAGEVVAVSAEDGGVLGDGQHVQAVTLDGQGAARLPFTTTQNDGLFRVTFRRGAAKQQFNFWVGPARTLQTVSK